MGCNVSSAPPRDLAAKREKKSSNLENVGRKDAKALKNDNRVPKMEKTTDSGRPQKRPSDSRFLYSIVDIGSNGIRCSISDLSPPWTSLVPAIYKKKIDISLLDVLKPPVYENEISGGAHISTNSDLTDSLPNSSTGADPPRTIPDIVTESLIGQLREFKVVVEDHHVPEEQRYVVATEALRSAQNSDDVQNRIFEATGWRVRLLSGQEESMMGVYGVCSVVADLAGGLVVDMGGGSVQFSWLRDRNRCGGSGNEKSSHRSEDFCGGSKNPSSAADEIQTWIESAPRTSIKRGAAAVTNAMITAYGQDGGDPDGENSRQVREAVFADVQEAITKLVPFNEMCSPGAESEGRRDEIKIYVTGGGFRGWGKVLRHRFERERGYYVADINGFEVVANMLVDAEVTHPEDFSFPHASATRNDCEGDDSGTASIQVTASGVSVQSILDQKHGGRYAVTTSSFASLGNNLNLGNFSPRFPRPSKRMFGSRTKELLAKSRTASDETKRRMGRDAGIGKRRVGQLPAVTLVMDSILATLVDGFVKHKLSTRTSDQTEVGNVPVPAPRIVIRFCEGGVRQGVLFRHQLLERIGTNEESGVKDLGAELAQRTKSLDASEKSLLEIVLDDEDRPFGSEIRTILPPFKMLVDECSGSLKQDPFSECQPRVQGNDTSSDDNTFFESPFQAFMHPIGSIQQPEVGDEGEQEPAVAVNNLSHRQRLLLGVMMCERWGGLDGLNEREKSAIQEILWGKRGEWKNNTRKDGTHQGSSPDRLEIESKLGLWAPPKERMPCAERWSDTATIESVSKDLSLGEKSRSCSRPTESDNGDGEEWCWNDGLEGVWPVDLESVAAAVWVGRQLRKD